MTNIFWVHAFASAPQESAAARHFSLQKDLKKLGINVSILACEKSHLSPKRPPEYCDKNSPGFIWLPGFSASGFLGLRLANIVTFFLCLTFLSKKTAKSADIVVGSTPDPLAAFGAYLLAKRLGKPFVLEIRDVWPETLIKLFNFHPFNPYVLFLGILEKQLYRRADLVLTTLPEISGHISRYAPRVEIIHVPNYVAQDDIPKTVVTPPEKSKTEIIYAGNMGVANDMETLLLAARILEKRGFADRLIFSIFGDGPMQSYLKTSFADLRIVKFNERIAREKLYERLAQSDAGIICWKKNSLYRHGISANKISDYLAVGLPIIMSYDYGHPIKEKPAGIVVSPEDPRALAEAIEIFVKMDSESRSKFHQNAADLGQQSFSFPAFGKQLANALINLNQGAPLDDKTRI